jgi:hypothetical protein
MEKTIARPKPSVVADVSTISKGQKSCPERQCPKPVGFAFCDKVIIHVAQNIITMQTIAFYVKLLECVHFDVIMYLHK